MVSIDIREPARSDSFPQCLLRRRVVASSAGGSMAACCRLQHYWESVPKPSVIATQQFSRSADYSMISSASVRRVVATKGLHV